MALVQRRRAKGWSREITEKEEANAPRIAASSYLNTSPLIWSFQYGARQREVELITDTAPARCADLLARGAVKAALVPVIEYQRVPDLIVVPEVCVGARRQVKSVVLVTRGVELKDVRRIALDASSRTSAALVEIIFREFFNLAPEFAPRTPDLPRMLDEYDAALIIGDPAMVFPRAELFVYDLAELWRAQTGLGFVFAMWMAREEFSAEIIRAVDFAGVRDEGLANVEEIVRLYRRELNLSRDELRTYLLENISFNLNAEMRAGLDLFYALARKHEIIPHARPLKLIDAQRG
jgi:chorismate dehydratase